MEIKTLQVSLECESCGQETLHEIRYINDRIEEIRCTKCQDSFRRSEADLLPLLMGELARRISSKPSRTKEEMKENFWRFAAKMPARVATKPFRFTKEILDMLDEVKNDK